MARTVSQLRSLFPLPASSIAGSRVRQSTTKRSIVSFFSRAVHQFKRVSGFATRVCGFRVIRCSQVNRCLCSVNRGDIRSKIYYNTYARVVLPVCKHVYIASTVIPRQWHRWKKTHNANCFQVRPISNSCIRLRRKERNTPQYVLNHGRFYSPFDKSEKDSLSVSWI